MKERFKRLLSFLLLILFLTLNIFYLYFIFYNLPYPFQEFFGGVLFISAICYFLIWIEKIDQKEHEKNIKEAIKKGEIKWR